MDIVIRLALVAGQAALEALQTRASLNNAGDREALMANPDAIELPLSHIEHGAVFVAEASDLIAGFATILPRDDGNFELGGLFVDPSYGAVALGASSLTIAQELFAPKAPEHCML